MKELGIGLIGANTERGWAPISHLPALASANCGNARLVAVATSRAETARKASEKLQVPGYADYSDLIADPSVDIVTVSVKLPLHHEIVSAALDAGKHVYCEWPLGVTLEEAEDLAARARAAKVHTMIGLQSRTSPALDRLGSLIAEGYVGDILSISAVASGHGWGAAIDPGNAYLFDADNGATLLTITGGHLLDAITRACGDIDQVCAYLPTRRERVAILSPEQLAKFRTFEATVEIVPPGETPHDSSGVVRTAESFTPTAPDHVALVGKMAGGAPLTVHIRGGLQRSTGLRIEVIGTKGELVVTGPAGVIQMVPLSLLGCRDTGKSLEPITIPADGREDLGPIASNLARLYAAFARDIQGDERTVADFDHAYRQQSLLAAIEASSQGGAHNFTQV